MKNPGFEIRKLAYVFPDGRLIFIPAAFLLGRAEMAAELMPFGFAFFAASTGILTGRFILALAILAGVASMGNVSQILVNISGMLIFSAMAAIFTKDEENPGKKALVATCFKYAVCAFISILVPMLAAAGFGGFLNYDLIMSVLYALVASAALFIFRSSLLTIGYRKGRQGTSNEEALCIIILLGLIASGLGRVDLFGVSIKNILCIAIVLAAAHRAGPALGAASGVVLGLTVGLPAEFPAMSIGIFGFCGFISGMLKNAKKPVLALGLIAANAALALSLKGMVSPWAFFVESLVAVGIFLVLPKNLLNLLKMPLRFEDGSNYFLRCSSERIRDHTVDRLGKFSGAFRELSKTFNEVSESMALANGQDISALLDKVADKVCKDCALSVHCWERNFYNTYQSMFKIIESLEQRGRVDNSDIPKYFLERCERVADFADAVNNTYELFKVDMVWKGKINESRSLISKQYEKLSEAILKLAEEIKSDTGYMEDLEEDIKLGT